MKRFLIIFGTCFLSIIAWAQTGKLPERTVENVSDGVIVTYKFDHPVIRPNKLYPGSMLWEYVGFGLSDELGKPAIPFRTDMFYVPAGHSAQITLLKATYKDTILVMSPAMSNPPDNGSRIVVDSITPYSGFYPNNVLEYDSLQKYHSIGLQNVTVIPVKYNYNLHKIRAYSEIKYKVTFEQDNARNTSKAKKQNAMSDMTNTFLSNVTLNYSPSYQRNTSTWHSTPNERNYVIFTTNEYGGAIQDFIKWKRMTGYNVYSVYQDKGTWTTEHVKEFAEAFLENMNVHCLLIVGGYDDIPAVPFSYTYWNGGTLVTANAVTDFEYGLPTTAGIPQIIRGRIPADNAQQVSTILNKIIQYEKNPIIDEDFYHTGLNCAEFQDTDTDSIDGYEDRCFLMTSENIRNHLIGEGYQVHRQYVKTSNITPMHWSLRYSNGALLPAELQPDSFSWNGNAFRIKSYFNSGVFYALHRDHGEFDGWYHPSFKTHDIMQLQNGNKLPVVFSLNCKTGKYNLSGDCFAEAFLKKSDGGCAGIFAATETSFSGYNDAMALGMFDAIWPNLQPMHYFAHYSGYSATPTPTYELGQILDQGLIRMRETYGLSSSYWSTITKKLFHCFGDPSMQIYTDTPQNFAEPLIYSRGDSIFVFVEDGDCRITFYDKMTQDVKSYNGNYAAYTNPTDSLVICLSRHNYVPYIWNLEKDVYIQNENILGETRVYKGNIVRIGNHVTATKPTGDVNIQNSHITVKGHQLELHPGTYIDKNFIFQNE